MNSPRSCGGLNENLSAVCEIPSHKSVAREVPEAPKTTQAIGIALGCPPYLGGKTLLLKAPLTLVVRPRHCRNAQDTLPAG